MGFLAFTACRNDDDNSANCTPDPVNLSAFHYLPSETGNWWVYETIQIDSNGVVTSTNFGLDTITVTGDSIVNGNTYKVFQGSWLNSPVTWLYRDSLGFLVNEKGEVHLSANNFTDTLATIEYPSILRAAFKMENVSGKVSVPFGDFDVVDYRSYNQWGVNYDQFPNREHTHKYYSTSGMVEETFFMWLLLNAITGDWWMPSFLCPDRLSYKQEFLTSTAH